MSVKELREKKIEELRKLIDGLEESVAKDGLDMRMGKLEDVRKPRRTRKELAKIYTIIREKELANLKKVSKDAEDDTKGKSIKK